MFIEGCSTCAVLVLKMHKSCTSLNYRKRISYVVKIGTFGIFDLIFFLKFIIKYQFDIYLSG